MRMTRYQIIFRFLEIYNQCFPVKTKKVHNKLLSKPWITNDLQKMIKNKNKLFGMKLKLKSLEVTQKYNKFKKEVKKKLYIAKNNNNNNNNNNK